MAQIGAIAHLLFGRIILTRLGLPPTPNPLEIVVALRQPGDNPDHIAALVEALRYVMGHYAESTALSAPLFLERVVRDYISDFLIEEEQSSAEE